MTAPRARAREGRRRNRGTRPLSAGTGRSGPDDAKAQNMTDEQSLPTRFADGVPDDDDLWGDLRWEDLRDSDEETTQSSVLLERFVHDRTGTCVDIYGAEGGGHSAQAKLGGYDEDAVIQPDDPNRFVSATTSVLELDNSSLAVTRAIAFSWIRGWAHRNNTYHDDGVRDLERGDHELPSAGY